MLQASSPAILEFEASSRCAYPIPIGLDIHPGSMKQGHQPVTNECLLLFDGLFLIPTTASKIDQLSKPTDLTTKILV